MADPDLAALAADYWTLHCELRPLQATALGIPGHASALPDISPEGRASADRRLSALEAGLAAIPAGSLQGEDALTRGALEAALMADRTVVAADTAAYTVDVTGGPQSAVLSVPSYQPLRNPEDGAALLERWRAMPGFLDEGIAALGRGRQEGRTPVGVLVDRVVDQLREQLATPLAEWTVAAPLQANHGSWPNGFWGPFATAVEEVVRDGIAPAMQRYLHALETDVRPTARDETHAGLGNLPGGAEIYRREVAAHTTTQRTPEEIHAIGLTEVERIDAEMIELGGRVLGTSSLAETQEQLRHDPAVHFATREEVASVASRSLERAKAAIPDWFGSLPQAPCVVVPMLPHEERHSTIAYYREPAADGSRPGQYYINTSEPQTRPRYDAEALAFHEAVPGHHLQLAIAQELEGLPEFRRFNEAMAFVEGWGLYTERLADEMGLYSGDLDRIGMLSFDAWRACRLVVDTGMHAQGWSRARAIEFMTQHSVLATNNIVNEVDRYLGWPGQALAYKSGQLEILALRAEARARLGERFDIRRFHDAVLTHGALPLSTLRESVARDL